MTEDKIYPNSWEVVPLGKFVENEKGKKPKKQKESSDSEFIYPYVDIEAFEKGVIKSWTNGEGCRLCNEDDFLMVWDGSRSGLVGKGMNGALGSTLVRINFSAIENKYAFYFLQSKYLEINTRAKGVGIPHVDPNLLWNYEFPIPPLNEQKRIVTKIEELFSELDKGIENLKAARAQLKVYRQAVLKHAFEGKLTAHWRNENTTKFGKLPSCDYGNEFTKLPEEWLYTSLGNVIKEPQYGTSKKCEYDIPGMGVLRIPNIVLGVVDSTDLKFAQFDANEINTYRLMKGDVLIIRSNGSISIVGKCALIKEKDEKFLYAGYLIKLRPNKELIYPEYLASILSSHFLRTQIEQKAKSTSGVNNINSGELKSLIIPICGVEEQKEIVARLTETLSSISRIEAEIETNLQKSEAMRQSILKKAFSGQIVAQDPKDEPASLLLERIGTEKKIRISSSKKTKLNRKAA